MRRPPLSRCPSRRSAAVPPAARTPIWVLRRRPIRRNVRPPVPVARSRRMSLSSCPRRSVRPVVVALVLGTLLLAPVATGGAGVPRATAAPVVSMPSEWEVRPSGHGTTVTWHSPARLPLGGAAPEFRAGGRLLGHPTPSADLLSLSLTLPTTRAPAPASLQVWLSGRRLDGSTPRSSVRATPYLGPARGQTTLPVDPGGPGPWAT